MRRWGAEPRAADRWPEDDAPAERWAAAPEEHDHAPGLCQVSCHTHSLQEGRPVGTSITLAADNANIGTQQPAAVVLYCCTYVCTCTRMQLAI